MRWIAPFTLICSLGGFVAGTTLAQSVAPEASHVWPAAEGVLLGELTANQSDDLATPSPLRLTGYADAKTSLPLTDPSLMGDGETFATLDQFERLQRQIDELRASNVSLPEPVVAPKAAPEKKYPDWRMTGFFQLDSAYFHQDDANRATLGDIQDGLGFRRARIAAAGNITPRASFLMEYDMAQAQARFVDVWGQINDSPMGNVRIGRFRQPFGMTELTSAREIPFIERPTIFATSPFRQTGIMFFDTALDEKLTWAFSGFRALSDNFGNVYGEDGGYGTSERITGLLVDEGDDHLIHLGFDHAYLDPARDQFFIASQDEVFVGQNPNLGLAGLDPNDIINVPAFISTGVFDVDYVNYFNFEAATSVGRALVQSEYRWTNIELPTGDNVTVHGGYIHARYVWTGETIPYLRSSGVFGRVTPKRPLNLRCGDFGAVESVARVSLLDTNPLFGQPGVPGRCRQLVSSSVGLNWYWFTNAKAQIEWINGQLDDPVVGKSDSNTFASRVQFDF